MLTQAKLKELLFYDSGTGLFVRQVKTCNTVRIGDIAGSINKLGYVVISVLNKPYLAHRLAWLYMFGEFPKGEVDHINRDKSDNRITNLRDVGRSQNSINTPVRAHSQIGHKNIKFDKRDSKYSVIFTRNHEVLSLGAFPNLELAIDARDAYLCDH